MPKEDGVANHFSLVNDLDDKRKRPYGEYYTRRNPLTLDALPPLATG